jgi:hypothetical protein
MVGQGVTRRAGLRNLRQEMSRGFGKNGEFEYPDTDLLRQHLWAVQQHGLFNLSGSSDSRVKADHDQATKNMLL